jgi:hypothetical protein
MADISRQHPNLRSRGSARPFNAQQAKEQQAVADQLRSGGVIRNPIPANPLARIGAFFTAPAGTKIPNLGAARLNGEEVLMKRDGFTSGIAGLGEINVAGQRFFPAQSGKDLIYRRGVDENNKRNIGGQFGNLLPRGSSQDPSIDTYVPPGERSYRQEVSRTAQLTAQDPELKRYEDARKIAAAQGATPESVKTAEDIGMQIWAKKYGGPGGLASKVKPGQAGYEAIQGVIAPGRGMPGSTSMYQGAFPTDDYRDYGEPQSPTVGYQMQSPITSVPGLNATTAQQVNTGAQVQAQDLADLFKNAVFDEELMKQIQQYN